MAGAPSQLDLFDYKPDLEKLHGQPLPKDEMSKGQRVTAMTRGKKQVICASIFEFAQQGAKRTVHERAAAASLHAGRRHLLDQVDSHRSHQSRSGQDVLLHRCGDARTSQHGVVAQLRAGVDEQGPARFHRVDVGVLVVAKSTSRLSIVDSGAPVFCLRSIKGLPFKPWAIQSCSFRIPLGVDRKSRAKMLEFVAKAKSRAAVADRRSRDSNLDHSARNGVSHADVRSRVDGLEH